MGGVFCVGARHDHEVGVLETVQVRKHLVKRLSKAHVGRGEIRARERQYDAFVLRQSELLAPCGLVVGLAERGPRGDAVIVMRSSGTLRGRRVSAIDSFATQKRSLCRWGHSPSVS